MNPQFQALEAFKHRPVVSAVLLALLALLVFVALGHRGEDRSVAYWSAVDLWETSAVAVVASDDLTALP